MEKAVRHTVKECMALFQALIDGSYAPHYEKRMVNSRRDSLIERLTSSAPRLDCRSCVRRMICSSWLSGALCQAATSPCQCRLPVAPAPTVYFVLGAVFVVRYQMGRLYALFWMKVLAWESRIRPDMLDASNRGQLRGIYFGGQTHPWTSWLRWPARSAKRFI